MLCYGLSSRPFREPSFLCPFSLIRLRLLLARFASALPTTLSACYTGHSALKQDRDLVFTFKLPEHSVPDTFRPRGRERTFFGRVGRDLSKKEFLGTARSFLLHQSRSEEKHDLFHIFVLCFVYS